MLSVLVLVSELGEWSGERGLGRGVFSKGNVAFPVGMGTGDVCH